MMIRHGIATRVAMLGAMLLAFGGTVHGGFLPFGTIDNFESQTLGSQPDEFHDADTGWVGTAAVVGSGTDGVTTTAFGGSQFLKLDAGPDGSYQNPGYRDGPYGHIGAQQAYPVLGDTYSVFADIFTKAADAGASGSFWWSNGINDVDTGTWLTENGFIITPGDSGWDFRAKGAFPTINLATETWYTMETVFDRSAAELVVTHNLYLQGQRETGIALYSETLDYGSLSREVLSSKVGGPLYSWFSVWNDNSVDSLYVDNIGTSPVPEPASMALLGIGIVGGVGAFRRKLKQAKE